MKRGFQGGYAISRHHPNSPVLTHAISHYLSAIKPLDDAFAEAQDLLRITPTWYMAHNLMANVVKHDFDKAVSFANSTIAARPDHALGYVTLACSFSLSGEFNRCLEQLTIVDEKQTEIETYAFFGDYSIENEPDFQLIKADRKYRPKFNSVVKSINQKRDRYNKQKAA